MEGVVEEDKVLVLVLVDMVVEKNKERVGADELETEATDELEERGAVDGFFTVDALKSGEGDLKGEEAAGMEGVLWGEGGGEEK